MANLINWFEIPAENFERAARFYSTVLDGEVAAQEMMGTKMGFLPKDGEDAGGAICAGENYKPSADGVRIYLNGGEDLNVRLARVEAAGGKIVMPKTKITDEIGYMAFFVDTEGNNVAFHSPK